MHITDIDFSDFVAIGISGFAVTTSIAAFFYRSWGKEKESRLLAEEKLQEEEISKNLSHVADIVKQVDESQRKLSDWVEKNMTEVDQRLRVIEIEHARGCALVARLKLSENIIHD